MAGGTYEREIARLRQTTACKSLIAIIIDGKRGSAMGIELCDEHAVNVILFLQDMIDDLKTKFPEAALAAEAFKLKKGEVDSLVRRDH
jgi:hypothetical protein